MKIKWIILLVGLSFFSCNTEETESVVEIEALKEENDALKAKMIEVEEKDSIINEYANFILDIQSNLNQINDKEATLIISSRNPEINRADESIVNDLKSLGALLAENKAKVNSMRSKLKNANGEISDLEKVIIKLTEQADAKDIKIRGLKNELGDLGVAFDELLTAYEDNIVAMADKNQTIETQQDELNTAYYTFGSSKELKNNNVISKEGGFIGIGTTKKLKTDFNRDYFTKIDITETKDIILNVKKAKFITTHPEGSYKLVGEDPIEKITITNAKAFWSVSKFLVLETK